MPVLLAADIGNTNVTVGAFEGERLLHLWRLGTDAKKTADEYGALLGALVDRLPAARAKGISGFAVGSVVPALTGVFERVARTRFGLEAFVVGPRTPTGLKLKVDEPDEVGADRLLNALAAWRLFGAPAVVLDFGTATTFDCLSSRGEYLGGAILIGPELIARALAEHTAKLPQVPIAKTRRVVARNTVECIQVGLYYGYLGMIDRVLDETLKEMGGRGIRVLATGGLADLFAPALRRVERTVPDLTLQGLRLAFEDRTLRKAHAKAK